MNPAKELIAKLKMLGFSKSTQRLDIYKHDKYTKIWLSIYPETQTAMLFVKGHTARRFDLSLFPSDTSNTSNTQYVYEEIIKAINKVYPNE